MGSEDRRLAALRSYDVMDSPGEPGFDLIARAAARACDVPLALVTFLDEERQAFKGRVGTDVTGAPRSEALCQLVLEVGSGVEVSDLTEDARWRWHPAVTAHQLRFYAGEPLVAPEGEVVGTLCVLDREPRTLTRAQQQALADLASLTMVLLQERRAALQAARAEASATAAHDAQAQQLAQLVDRLPVGYAFRGLDGRLREVNPEFCRLAGRPRDQLLGAGVPGLLGPECGHLDEQPPGATTDLLEGRSRALRRSRTWLHPDGTRVAVVVTTMLVRDATGRPAALASYVLEDADGPQLADRSAADGELQRRQQFLGSLLPLLDVGLVACDTDGRLVLWHHGRPDRGARSDGPDAPATAWWTDEGVPERPRLFDAYDARELEQPEWPLQRVLRGEDVDGTEYVLHEEAASRRLRARGHQVRAVDGEVLGAVVVLTDLSGQPEQQRRGALLEEQTRLAFRHSPIGMSLMTAEGEFLEVNDALCRMLGYPAAALHGRPVAELMADDDVPSMRTAAREAADSGATTWVADRRYRAADGRTVLARVTVVRLVGRDGRPLLLGQVEDLTEQRAVEQRLAETALFDRLTGLPARALFTDRVRQALARAARTSRPLAVLACDLDGFGQLNAVLGRAAGDDALRRAADRLVEAVHGDDTVGHLGGDDFVVLREDCDEVAAARLARRLQRALRERLPADAPLELSASIGLVVHTPGRAAAGRLGAPADVEGLLRSADVALARAKRDGRDRTRVFDAALRAEIDDRTRVERLLRERLRADEVEVHYQPVVDLADGRVRGVEALCRLRDEQGGLVPPSLFVAVAEEVGLVCDLGELVLRTAVDQAVRWAAGRPDLHVAVNASAQQAGRPDFAGHVLDVLRDAGLPPGNLVVELTESVLLQPTAVTVDQLQRLRRAGVRIAIDDFGTRYSSLRYVQRLPVSQLKIDMGFTAGLPDGRPERAIVRSIALLASSLELDCVAEGIETPAQLAHLAELSQHGLGLHGQGYLLGRPSPAADVDLRDRPVPRADAG